MRAASVLFSKKKKNGPVTSPGAAPGETLLQMALRDPVWYAAHAAFLPRCALGGEGDDSTLHRTEMGARLHNETFEHWVAMAGIFRHVLHRGVGSPRQRQLLHEFRKKMEGQMSKLVRFIPAGRMQMASDGAELCGVLQRVAGRALVRSPAGVTAWRDGAGLTAADAGPAELPEFQYEDRQCHTASNKQMYRRYVLEAPDFRVAQILDPHATGAPLQAPQAALDGAPSPSRKRKPCPEPTERLPPKRQHRRSGADGVRCFMLGPFGLGMLPAVIGLYDDGLSVVSERNCFQPFPVPGQPGQHVALAFACGGPAGAEGLLAAAAALGLPCAEVTREHLDLGRNVGSAACNVKLAVDSLSFTSTSLRSDYEHATYAQRAAMQPKGPGSRMNPLKMLWQSVYPDAPVSFTLEGLVEHLRGLWAPAPAPPTRCSAIVERAAAGTDPHAYSSQLYIQHKATPELARQMFDCFSLLWMLPGTDAAAVAAQTLWQLHLDGYYIRMLAN
jgi:hypothetical protein